MSSQTTAPASMFRRVIEPLHEVLRALDNLLSANRFALPLVFLGLFLGWWLYVPLHELLHVLGCLVSGGSVETLELSPLYGGRQLEKVFPFVQGGGEYAGRLSAFEPNGDIGYLATDLGPFVLSVPLGVWWTRRAARWGAYPKLAPALWGAGLPFALAPLLSLTGDAYEIGSLMLVQFDPFAISRPTLLSDDLFVAAGAITTTTQAAGVILAASIGLVWALATLLFSGWVVRKLGEPAVAVVSSIDPARRP